MAIDPNANTTTNNPAMDQHNHLHVENQLLQREIEILRQLNQLRQGNRLLHHENQKQHAEDSLMKTNEPQPELSSSSMSELEPASEKSMEDDTSPNDSDVTVGNDTVAEQESMTVDNQVPADSKRGGETKKGQENGSTDFPEKVDEDKMDEDEKHEHSEEEQSSYANSEASDYDGPEAWDGGSLGEDPDGSDSEDETMEDKPAKDPQERVRRNHFIAAYKQRLGTATPADEKLMKEFSGSSSALGDCKLDTWLYYDTGLDATRKDYFAYKSLYGFHPGIVESIEYEPTITLLNKHAEIVVSGYKQQEFHDRFREFIEAFEKAEYPANYLERDLSSEVARAHFAFCNALSQW